MSEILLDEYLQALGYGMLPCELLCQFCRAQPEPKPESYVRLGNVVGTRNIERDVHTWAAGEPWMSTLPFMISRS